MKNKLTTFALCLLMLTLTISSALADSPRKALVEQATNAGCGPCASNNPAFKAYLNENADVIIPVVYHTSGPGTDPMHQENSAMNAGRTSTYYGISSVPHFYCNGIYHGNTSQIKALADTYIKQLRQQTSPIDIVVNETRSGTSSNVSVDVKSSKAINGYKLRIVVIERRIVYSTAPGTNGETEFDWVARQMLPDHNGTTISLSANESKNFSFNYSLKSNWKADQIYVVAFVQDDATKEVFQTSTIKENKVTLSFQDRYLKIDPASQVKGKITVTNPNAVGMQFELSVPTDNSIFPNGWSASIEKTKIYLDPNASETINMTISNTTQAAGFCMAAVSVAPLGTSGLNISSSSYITALSNNTKYAVYYGTSNYASLYVDAFTSLSKYNSTLSLIPVSKDILEAYPSTNFDFSLFAFDFNSRGAFSSSGSNVSEGIMQNINTLIQNGKKVLIMAEDEFVIANSDGSAAVKNFYNNVLGIEYGSTPYRIQITDGYITGVYNFKLQGYSGDVISDGFDITANNYKSNSDPYIISTDYFTVKSGSKSEQFLYYDENKTHGAAVRLVKDKAKVVYLSFGFEAVTAQADRKYLMKKIMDWFDAEPEPEKGQITTNIQSIGFGNTYTETSGTLKEIIITNTGNATLNISNIQLTNNEENVFTIIDNPVTKAVEKEDGFVLKLRFTPLAAKPYSCNLVISSDSKTDAEKTIPITGTGLINSVKEDVSINDLVSVSVGPNPFSTSTKINVTLNGNESKYVDMYVVNSIGVKVLDLMSASVAPGSFTKELNSSVLSNGTYYVVVKIDGKTIELPVVLVK